MVLHHLDPSEIQDLRVRLLGALRPARTVEDASQRLVREVRLALGDTAALCRLYGTIPFRKLTEARQIFARGVAEKLGDLASLSDETLVLSLLGTAGADASWNAANLSQGHLAIPLLNQRFVQSAPMVASMLRELGLELVWQHEKNAALDVKQVSSGFLGVFHVPDAATTKDTAGRHVIPAQDFVRAHGIKTVFGLGGYYAIAGTVVVLIVFSKDAIERARVAELTPLMSTFKTATTSMVRSGQLFG